jgi:GTP-binding protein
MGRSNVGKSSLLNALAGNAKLARTSATPGRTRAVNYFLVDGRYYLVDLPGYGWARASREDRARLARVSERYLETSAGGPRRRVVLLVDGKVGATDLDRVAARFLAEIGARVWVVATKADQVKRGERDRQGRSIRASLELAEGTPLIFVSAHSGEGLTELWREIATDL